MQSLLLPFRKQLILLLVALTIGLGVVIVGSVYFVRSEVGNIMSRDAFQVTRWINQIQAQTQQHINEVNYLYDHSLTISQDMKRLIALKPSIKLVAILNMEGQVLDEFQYSVRNTAFALPQQPQLIEQILKAPNDLHIMKLPFETMPALVSIKPIYNQHGVEQAYLVFAYDYTGLWQVLLEEQLLYQDQVVITHHGKLVFCSHLHWVENEKRFADVLSVSPQTLASFQLNSVQYSEHGRQFIYGQPLFDDSWTVYLLKPYWYQFRWVALMAVIFIIVAVMSIRVARTLLIRLNDQIQAPLEQIEHALEKHDDSGEYQAATLPSESRFAKISDGLQSMFDQMKEYERLLKHTVEMSSTQLRNSEQRQEKIAETANKDPLTGLYNRLYFHKQIEMLVNSRSTDSLVAVYYCDLDGFKPVNDTLGHAAGDDVLKIVSERMMNCTRSTDILARIGGDEFAIVQPGIKSTKDIQAIAQKVVDAISRPISIGNDTVELGVSIGVSICPDHSEKVSDLLMYSDLAMYAAKTNGKNQYQLFTQSLKTVEEEHAFLISELQEAFEKDQLKLYFQPVVDMHTNALKSLESLLRWHHPKMAVLSAGKVLTTAINGGLVNTLGEWIYRQAIAAQAQFKSHGFDVEIAVNVDALQLRNRQLPSKLEQAMREMGVDPNKIAIEMNEHEALSERNANHQMIEALRSKGLKIIINEIGQGYCSISTLNALPLSALKLSRKLVTNVHMSGYQQRMVKSLVALGSSLEIPVTAVGVEQQEELAFVKEAGCECVQGYIVCKPLPQTEMMSWLHNHETPSLTESKHSD